MHEILDGQVMEFIEKFLSEYWQYVTLVIGAGFVIFGFICNKIKLPKFLNFYQCQERKKDIV